MEAEVKCQFTNSDSWNETIKAGEIAQIIKIPDSNERIAAASDLFIEKIKKITLEDSLPGVIICALPLDIEEYCGITEKTRDAKKLEDSISENLSDQNNSQKLLEEWIVGTEKQIKDEDEETEKSYDLRNALKGKAMQFDIPTQILRESVARSIFHYPSSKFKTTQTPAAFAWNFSTSLYYKAHGRPWRLAKLTIGTCYVGIAFYQNKRKPELNLETSLAQIFTHNGDGFVLRGADVGIDKETKEAYLTKAQARKLLSDSIKKYTYKVENPPSRVVVYKTSPFTDEEKTGFDDAIGDLKKDYVWVSKRTDLRILRTGKYPVLRGTMMSLTPNQCLLYTSGYIPRIRTYPGHRVPRPLLITHDGDSELEVICSEILGLTKLNWNTTVFSKQLPITIEFAQSVGKILSEIPETIKELKDHYRFYM